MKAKIEKFFTSDSFGVAGVSNSGKKFGSTVYKYFKERDFTVYPINNKYEEYDGKKCYRSVKDLPEEVKSLVIVVSPDSTESIIKECIGTNVKNIWMQQGSKSENAIELAEQNNLTVIYDECVLMFLEPVKSIHAFHRWINKLFGKYPK